MYVAADDSNQAPFFKFVCDIPGDMTSGHLYAAQFTQTSEANFGSFK